MLELETLRYRAVISGGAGGALATPEFISSVNPIPTRGGRLCPPHYCTPGFENLMTSLQQTWSRGQAYQSQNSAKLRFLSEIMLVYTQLYVRLQLLLFTVSL